MTNRTHGQVFCTAALAATLLQISAPSQAANRVTVHGNARTVNGVPVCAMVLANGQYMFSCGGAGAYRLDVSPDANGQITLFVFADGFAPYRVTTGPGNFPLAVQMQTAGAKAPLINMSRSVECSALPNRLHISGEIESAAGEPLCAMVLSNGEHMFSCDASLGQYDFDVPVDKAGQVTVFGFADGFQPYRNTFTAPDCGASNGVADSVQGALSLSHGQSAAGVSVTASASFMEDVPEMELPVPYPELEECLFSASAPFAAEDLPFVTLLDAGPAVKLVRGDGQSSILRKNPQNQYLREGDPLLDPAFYQGGQSYVFSGSGGPEVGPFETPPVSAPPALDLISPMPAAPPYIVRHDSDQPLRLVWNNNAGTGEVEALLVANGKTAVYQIWCRFTDEGSAEMPSSLLVQVRESLKKDPSVLASPILFVDRKASKTFESPGLTLDVSMGSNASVPVQLE